MAFLKRYRSLQLFAADASMGQRANLILVENQRYSLYYSHWCANTLPRDLFWGPDHAVRFVRIQREVDDSDWLDDIWAEGGCVIDLDNRVLLLYGGEDVQFDIPLRRVYLEMLSRIWRQWDIRWAHEGIADLADYVRYPRVNVLAEDEQEHDCVLSPPQQRDWTDSVGSCRFADGTLRFYPLAGTAVWYLLAGPVIVRQCDRSTGEESLPLDEWLKEDFPQAGFHLDLPARKLDYWAADDIPGVPDRVAALWSDWSVMWHRDRFEFQVEASDGALCFPTRTMERLQEEVKAMLLQDYEQSSANTIVPNAELFREHGMNVEINPWALRDDRLEVSADERRRVVGIALGWEEANGQGKQR